MLPEKSVLTKTASIFLYVIPLLALITKTWWLVEPLGNMFCCWIKIITASLHMTLLQHLFLCVLLSKHEESRRISTTTGNKEPFFFNKVLYPSRVESTTPPLKRLGRTMNRYNNQWKTLMAASWNSWQHFVWAWISWGGCRMFLVD